MALVGLTIDGTREYTSKLDAGESPTVWVLGTLSGRQRMLVKDSSMGFQPDSKAESGMSLSFHGYTTAYETVRLGLRGCRNFVDTKGEEIPFQTTKENVGGVQTQVVTKAFMDRIPSEVVTELAGEINQDNALNTEQRGNSVE